MKIVSWNCNGGFRKKFKELFNAYPDANLFMVQECENPDFYNSREYKDLFQKGFHVGTPDYSMKGIGIFSPKGHWLRRIKCKYGNPLHMLGYAFFEMDNQHKMLAVWTHGKYVEEMIDFLHLNETLFTNDLLIMGDTNSCSVLNNHPKYIAISTEVRLFPFKFPTKSHPKTIDLVGYPYKNIPIANQI